MPTTTGYAQDHASDCVRGAYDTCDCPPMWLQAPATDPGDGYVVMVQVEGSMGGPDVEFLDGLPGASLLAELDEMVGEGQITYWCVRDGYLNGGDSALLLQGGTRR